MHKYTCYEMGASKIWGHGWPPYQPSPQDRPRLINLDPNEGVVAYVMGHLPLF
jgi:hypothetical protein